MHHLRLKPLVSCRENLSELAERFFKTYHKTKVQAGADLGQNFRGRQELWNNFAINDRGKFLVLML